jgi:hypothetical protein
MAVGRFIGRAITGIVGLGVLAFVVLPVALAVVPMIMLAVAGVIGAALLFTIGLPALLVGVLVLIALGALISVTFGLVSFGWLLLKIAIAAIVVSWLFRALFGRPRRREAVLVGPPIAEVSAPRRDKYDVEAERELDRELGL